MSHYNNVYGGCFSGDSLVTLADGSLTRIDRLKKGTWVLSGRTSIPVKVKCIVRTHVVDDKTGLLKVIRMSQKNLLHLNQYGTMGITAWHPILLGGEWVFPATCASEKWNEYVSEDDSLTEVYNLVLEDSRNNLDSSDHTILVGGFVACTLGHGITENSVITHEYYGNMNKIVDDLSKLPGWENGEVTLKV